MKSTHKDIFHFLLRLKLKKNKMQKKYNMGFFSASSTEIFRVDSTVFSPLVMASVLTLSPLE
jgi:hypothetical protein